jgi:hypothetical protein
MRNMWRSMAAMLILAVASATELGAQPSILQWRLDAPTGVGTGSGPVADSLWSFENMAPGWHVTTGPAVMLFDPSQSATGQYSIDALIHLFPNPPEDGSGLFIGGTGFTATDASYLLFAVRRDGSFRISEHTGRNVRVLKGWTADSAILAHPGGEEVKANRIRVTVRPDSVVMYVNSKPVAAVAKAGLQTTGIFGLRIAARTNVHVANLDFIRHLAPIPGGGG